MGGGGYDYINPANRGSAGTDSRYTVQGGETLAGIAAQVWGDSSAWYKIAEANGLSADSMLVAGQTLKIPDKVVNAHNNAATFRPYDTADAMGDLSPTTPKPPKKNKCGMFGQVLLVAVAIAVTALLPEISPFFETFGGQILGAMIASTVSQGVGLATGIQQKFDFKAVAMAGVTDARTPKNPAKHSREPAD